MCRKFFIIDTFGEQAFCGEPVAVSFVDTFEHLDLFANIANELNTRETAFVKHNGDGSYEIMVFCAGQQSMPFGVSPFAVAFAISILEDNSVSDINIVHGCNVYKANVNKNNVSVRFPLYDVNRLAVPRVVQQAFNEIVVSIVECKNMLLVELRSQGKISAFVPDVGLLTQIEHDIIAITSDSHYDDGADYDYCTRVFAPKLNIGEVIVSPFAHCAFYEYWNARLNKSIMRGQQFASRPVVVDICSDNGGVRVDGRCWISAQGTLMV